VTISNPQIEVKDAAAAGWFGAREEVQLPVRGPSGGWSAKGSATAGDSSAVESRGRIWMRRARRVALDLAIVLAAMTAVPVLAVSLSNGAVWRSGPALWNAEERVRAVEASRPFTIPADPSITPLDAGRSFLALQDTRSSAVFPTQDVPHLAATWRSLHVTSTMFREADPSRGHFASPTRIMQAAQKGFSAEEMEYLRKLASAPAWRDFDRVARAPAMDMIGGQFKIPFSPAATAFELPITQTGALRDAAEAAVSRAAYHFASGQRDSAEVILRSIVSFGFAMVDNGPGLVHQLSGRSVVAIGMEGLESFYSVTHDPRAAAVRAARPNFLAPARQILAPADGTVEAMRRDLIRRIDDPNEPRGIRFYSLRELSMSSCTNVRELLFGPRADVDDAFARAKHELARYPSEQAYIDLIRRPPGPNTIYARDPGQPLRWMLVGASTIAGAALHNPRLAECTMVTLNGGNY
jgi:hypothetical protein